MVKYIGIAILASGILLLALEIIMSRKQGVQSKASELSMIKSSGYAATHIEAESGARAPEPELGQHAEIKIAPKKRTLSKEAQDILALVEKERAEEKAYHQESVAPASGDTDIMKKKSKDLPGTDILYKDRGREGSSVTDILRRDKKDPDSTDVLNKTSKKSPHSNTDVLDRSTADHRKDRTDILERKPQEREATDILKGKPAQDGTDILRRDTSKRDYGRSEGTDILERDGDRAKSGATDILRRGDNKEETADADSTDILQRDADTGTDILERRN